MTPQALLDCLADTAHMNASLYGADSDSVVTLLVMRKTVLELIQANTDLRTALADALSTFRHDDKETMVSAERQEAWKAALDRSQPAPHSLP